MKTSLKTLTTLCLVFTIVARPMASELVGKSPWGPDDQIGTLNLMTDASRMMIHSRVASGKTYDLSVEYFVGMPSFHHLAERGVMFLEQMQLEELARDRVYEFVFIAASLKLRGASGAPMRPIALPVLKQ